MEPSISTAPSPMRTPIEAPLKSAQMSMWGAVNHPCGAGVTASTASGPSASSDSSVIRTVSRSFTRPSSLDGTDSYTPGSRSDSPTAARRQYVAVLPGVLPSNSASRGIPPNSVAMAETSPAWCQYQTNSTAGPFTPVYCSLTPTRTTSQHSTAPGDGAGGQMQRLSYGRALSDKHSADSSGSSQDPSVQGDFSSQKEGAAEGRRRSSLMLNETPLQAHALPEEVQALIQEARGPPKHEPSTPVPDWFDAEFGCIRRECLPELPSFRITLNTSAAKLSVSSRVYQRTRWPGEPARVTPCDYHSKDRGVRRISCPDAALLRRRSDSTSGLSGPPTNPRAAAGSTEHSRNSVLSESTDGLASRSRRVRFATVAAAREYKEWSPAVEGSSASGLPLRAASHPEASWELAAAADFTQMLQGQKAAQERATGILRCMTDLIRRLMNLPSLQKQGRSMEELEASLRLLSAFETECAGRTPALCFLADTLEACQQLVEQKLPEEERKTILELLEATKAPLLSRDAVMTLHRIRQEMRHPKDLDLLLTPLEVLQRLRICDRRKAITGLCLYAATADEPLLEADQQRHSNVFLVRDSACGVVSSRPWNGGNNFRAFAGDVLRRCEKGVAAAKERYTQGDDLPVPGKETQACNSTSLANLVEEALKNTAEFGTCSMGLLSFDNAGEKLRFATCGFMRVLVLRRSPASGILCRVAESPVRNAAAAAETQLFRWPSKKALLEEFGLHQGCDSRGGVTNAKGSLDLGARRQGLQRLVEWAENGDGWSSRGLVEQEVAAQEGDMFIIADDILFEVVNSEEMRQLFSCCLTSAEGKDLTDVSLCMAASCLPTLLKRLWRQRVPNLQRLLSRMEERQQRLASRAIGRRAVAEKVEACPLDLSIAAGWIRRKSNYDAGAFC